MPFVSLNGTFNFGPMMKAEGNKLNPFATAGVGMYMWYFSENQRTNKQKVGEEEFKASSLGINFGAGVEYFVKEKLSVFGRLNYHMVMMKDKDKFGEDFANQGFLTFGAGVTYYLFTGSK
jgi:opacity protein-like surface antigen